MDFLKCTSFNDTPLSMVPLNISHKTHIKGEEKEEASGHPVEKDLDLDVDLSEVYFLIMHFLSAGPCQKTIRQFWGELGEHQLLPRRYHAWYSRSGGVSGSKNDNGSSFPLTYEEVVRRYSYIEKDHLLKLLKQLMLTVTPLRSINDRCDLSAADVPTLLGAGPFSLLGAKCKSDVQKKPLPAYLRWPHMQADQVLGLTLREIGGGFRKHHRAPSIRFACYAVAKPKTMVQKMQNIKKLRGHRDAVYCAIFDRTGRYVITGSDDRLVKIWSMETGFSLVSCRGHEGDITDLAVSSNNALVASASNDFSIRVWRVPDGLPISILRGHTAAVTAIAFSPRPGFVYQLLSSSDDGSCRIWDARYSHSTPRIYLPKPTDEVAGKGNAPSSSTGPSSSTASQCHQILCCAYNANGTVFVTGSSDTYARVWSAGKLSGDDSQQPYHEIDVLAGHENDVNYVQFSGTAVASRSSILDYYVEEKIPKFKNTWYNHENIVTCSRDGSAIIWIPKTLRSQGKVGRWTRAYHLKVPPPPMPPRPPRGGPRQRLLPTPRGVNMIAWSLDNRFVLAAIMDCRICVWNASDGSLVHSLTGHSASTYVLDVHPFNPRIAMSAGYDGKTIVWDIWEGTPIHIYEIGRYKLVDGKFSPDGTSIVLSDDVGQIYLINTGQGESQKDAKYDQFFLGDYRPLIQDAQGNVLDQETQLAPYRRNIQDPLCDSSMLPYPEPYQNTYQRRRLGALGIEWRPSSIDYALGTYIGLGQEYQLLPLADLDTVFEPHPEFLDATLFEPENDIINDDTDSEYNITEEFYSGDELGNLGNDSSSDSECSEEDNKAERIHRHGLRRSKRKNLQVGLMTSPGRLVKSRKLGEHDGNASSSKRPHKKSRPSRLTKKRKSSTAMSLRPQRIAARSATNVLSQISEASTAGEDEEDLEDVSSESESFLQASNGQTDESDEKLRTVHRKYPKVKHGSVDMSDDVTKPLEQVDTQMNGENKKRLVLKISLKDRKKSVPSEITISQCNNQNESSSSFPRPNGEPSSLVTDAELSKKQNLNKIRDSEDREIAEDPIETSTFQKDTKTGWREARTHTSKQMKGEDIDAVESCSEHQETLDGRSRSKIGAINRNIILNDDGTSFCGSGQQLVGDFTDCTESESIVGTSHSHELKENPTPKPIKLRIKSKNSTRPRLHFNINIKTSDAVFSSDRSSINLEGYNGEIGEGTSNNSGDNQDAGVELCEAAPQVMSKTRSLRLKGPLREKNDINHSLIGHLQAGTSGNAKKTFDKPQSDEWMSNLKTIARSRSTRNKRGIHNNNDKTLLAGRNSKSSHRKSNWLLLSEQEDGYRYIPQLGDIVVYLRQGHEEYIESSHCSYDKVPWKLFGENVRVVETCLVEGLDYAPVPGSGETCCKVTLKFTDSILLGRTFELTLPDLIDFPDFVVEKSRYDAAIDRNWAPRDKCLVWWRDDNENGGSWWEGRIVDSKDKSGDFPDSPWERFGILYKNDSGVHHHSPWELHDPDSQWEQPSIDCESKKKMMSYLSKLWKSAYRNQDKYGVAKLKQVAQKTEYMNRFPVPLSLEIIELRLESNYYRSLRAMEHDIMVMLNNAQMYFMKNAELSRKVTRLSDWFTNTLPKFEQNS